MIDIASALKNLTDRISMIETGKRPDPAQSQQERVEKAAAYEKLYKDDLAAAIEFNSKIFPPAKAKAEDARRQWVAAVDGCQALSYARHSQSITYDRNRSQLEAALADSESPRIEAFLGETRDLERQAWEALDHVSESGWGYANLVWSNRDSVNARVEGLRKVRDEVIRSRFSVAVVSMHDQQLEKYLAKLLASVPHIEAKPDKFALTA